MEFNELLAISPIDGRYLKKTGTFRNTFSEFGLMKFRIITEIRWLQAMATYPEILEIRPFSNNANEFLENLIVNFNETNAKRIKQIEAETNHDTKAIEYFLKEKFKENSELQKCSEFIHFGCTSEDINNLAYAQMLKIAHAQHILPLMDELIGLLRSFAHSSSEVPMLSRTHGQPASPTTIGKEIANTCYRLKRWRDQLRSIEILGKMNGAVGNFNAHIAAYPEVDWLKFSKSFVESLELSWNPYTTQIEPHDYIADYCYALVGFNTVLLDFDRDVWSYMSCGHFNQRVSKNEVGSSTMPHKVNPIDFENSEGNIGVANAILLHLATKLPVSRLQRDLSDSSTLRNMGVGIAHTLISMQGAIQGIKKIIVNSEYASAELLEHWEILAEPIQTVMRRYGVENPYEKLKELTQGKQINREKLHQFVDSLDLPEAAKSTLKELTPTNYLGNASQRAKDI